MYICVINYIIRTSVNIIIADICIHIDIHIATIIPILIHTPICICNTHKDTHIYDAYVAHAYDMLVRSQIVITNHPHLFISSDNVEVALNRLNVLAQSR